MSRAKGKGLVEEEVESRDEFGNLHRRIDVLQNQVLQAARKDGIDEKNSSLRMKSPLTKEIL